MNPIPDLRPEEIHLCRFRRLHDLITLAQNFAPDSEDPVITLAG